MFTALNYNLITIEADFPALCSQDKRGKGPTEQIACHSSAHLPPPGLQSAGQVEGRGKTQTSQPRTTQKLGPFCKV